MPTNHPTPAEPTPTMGEAIARVERLQSSLSEWDFTDADTDALDLALVAMRAVEAGPRAWEVWLRSDIKTGDGFAYSLAGMHRFEDDARGHADEYEPGIARIIPLYAFPSRGQQAGGA